MDVTSVVGLKNDQMKVKDLAGILLMLERASSNLRWNPLSLSPKLLVGKAHSLKNIQLICSFSVVGA